MDKAFKHLSDMERKLTKCIVIMDKGAAHFTLKDVVKLSRKTNSILATMKKAHKEIKATTGMSDAEGQQLLDSITRICDLNAKQMKFTIENKPQFDKLHIAGIVIKQMEKNEGDGRAFAETIVEKAPDAYKPGLDALNKKMEVEVNHVKSVYAGATGGEDVIDDKVDDSD